MYLQDDRDLRAERMAKKLEKAYSFMIRLRIPGGVLTPAQWLVLDHIARTYANGALRATTRQTFQYHGVIKSNLKRTMKEIDGALLDTIAACGDVNRNVLSASNPFQSHAHARGLRPGQGDLRRTTAEDRRLARDLARRREGRRRRGRAGLRQDLPAAEIQDRGRGARRRTTSTYSRTTSASSPCWIGNDRLQGWNVTIGGGMGMTHGEPETFPRTADVIGFCTSEQALKVAESVMTVQRDWGDRTNRKAARLKYTIEKHGLDAFRAEVERRVGQSPSQRRSPSPSPITATAMAGAKARTGGIT
ncbi:MAG: hypothetical protein WDN49_05230 [Acetobacteraceae bacterium]